MAACHQTFMWSPKFSHFCLSDWTGEGLWLLSAEKSLLMPQWKCGNDMTARAVCVKQTHEVLLNEQNKYRAALRRAHTSIKPSTNVVLWNVYHQECFSWWTHQSDHKTASHDAALQLYTRGSNFKMMYWKHGNKWDWIKPTIMVTSITWCLESKITNSCHVTVGAHTVHIHRNHSELLWDK